ncbi:hypothetical protein D9756_005071 [Leucocoprinus leucothites]|uniref:Cytochrome P450 n=1 Tax=Leucocoprinus leucothites TaxID=201217 RepID=A0A8H5G9X2_9AGAR|nr:hypothetical protein D9756_005071 [Leucoagaricus leucothites]
MLSMIAQGLVAYVGLVVTWKILKWSFVESPLECVPGPPALSLIGGNVQQLFDQHGWKFYYNTLERYGTVTKMKGLLGENMLFTFDPKALYHILVKDQHIYEEATAFVATNKLMFGDGLLSALGEQHRKQRKMLTPVFSITHMRAMTPIFYEVTHRLHQTLLNQVKDGPKEVDILHWMTRTALELIGQSGMGYSFDSLKEDHDSVGVHPYARSVKRFGGLLTGPSVFMCNYLFPFANQLNFPRVKRWIVDHIPSQWVQDMKNIADVMEETAKDICRAKQKEIMLGESDETKKDIISILMRANASAAEEDRLTDTELVAQIATLVFAAMDTTSTALSRILYLLTQHPHVQERLRAELIEAKRNNGGEDLGYDQLVTLPYLDAVCRETLRVYPPLGTASRTARKDMVLPLSKPLRTISGKEVTELIVPNGTTIFLSIVGANTNPEMWGTDSYEWKPERWLKPLPEKVGEAHLPGIYSNLLTFLGGSRACIGFKFSQLEMKVVLSMLLTSFKFEDTGKSIVWKLPGIASPSVEGKDRKEVGRTIGVSGTQEPFFESYLDTLRSTISNGFTGCTRTGDSPLECVPGPPASSFIAGNVLKLLDEHGWEFYYDTLKRYGTVTKIKGPLGENLLLVYDPKALHHILVKDQLIYEEATALVAINKLMFGDGLISVLGEQHRKQRKMLTPVFSTTHMRAMTPIFYEVTRRLRQALLTRVKDGPKEVDILHWMTRTALELIGQSGMGYSFDSLEEDHDSTNIHPYARSVKRFGGLQTRPFMIPMCQYVFPWANQFKFPRLKRWILDHIPWQSAQDMKNIADVMEETAKDICRAKQKEIMSGESDESKKDIISTLIRANENAAKEDRLTDAEVVAQVATLVFAAMDTTSSALSRILSLLTQHPSVQDRLRAELFEAKENNGSDEFGYDRVMNLPYLDAVCRETLRLYPPLGTPVRTVRKDMVLPLSKPLKTTSGKEITELIVPNGTDMFLSILGANTNPDMWGPDSYEWKPERWLKPLPDKVGEAHMPGIYSNLMTFLGGGRACIGFKFSQLEMKVVLSVLLTSFKFEDAGKTIMWKMPGISSPSVEGKDSTQPALPMILMWKVSKWLFVESPLECVPGPPALSFLSGNVQQFFEKYGWKFYYDTLERYGTVAKIKGLLGENMLLIFDPKALHHILVKDQLIYEEATAVVAVNKLLFGDGLLSVLGEQHRKQRKMLTPVFSIAHMRAMTPIFYEVTHRLRQALLSQVKDGPKEIDILHWMARTALELIGQSGMGYSFDSLEEDHNSTNVHPYARSVKRFGGLLTGPSAFVMCNYLFPYTNQFNFPRVKRWIVDCLPSQWIQDMKNISDVMEETAMDIYRAKQKEIMSGKSDETKKDIISILMRANVSATEEDRLTDEEVVAQVATLVFAAMDTTSSALSRILSLLTQHPHVQEKLREELIQAKKDNGGEELGYDQLVTLPYLDAICRETLRVYPPVATGIRTARKDMVLPLSKPLKTTSGKEVTELIIPNGTNIFISILGANTNPEVWGPDSYEWKPERWLEPLPDKVVEAHMPGVYSNLMTFFGGSRACIGFKFSQLEMKVVLSMLLTTFNFEDTGKTIMWKLPGISSPNVGGKDVSQPALPIIISLLEKE